MDSATTRHNNLRNITRFAIGMKRPLNHKSEVSEEEKCIVVPRINVYLIYVHAVPVVLDVDQNSGTARSGILRYSTGCRPAT